ncbi:MAG: alpha/beta hydrolase [Proteobacteria bacterium]|nr:alpha/beta hydrolase [Pseudomonadota bacterium]
MSDKPEILARADGASIAYHRLPGKGPGIVFLGGFASDMTGTKAKALETHCRRRGQAFLRFDYRGHGQSRGAFEEGSIGLWASDAIAAIDSLTEGPQILVGSSMGGWIMMLAARALPERVAALVGIAAAPDFTQRMWDRLPDEAREVIRRDGVWRAPSDYSEEGLPLGRALFADGPDQMVMTAPFPFAGPVRLLQGMEDPDVVWRTALDICERVDGANVAVTLIKDGDHRLSRPQDLARLGRTLDSVTAELRGEEAETI